MPGCSFSLRISGRRASITRLTPTFWCAPPRRQQARQLERALWQQRLAGACLELSLRTYNSCLGEAERELADAAAEIGVGAGRHSTFGALA